MSQIKLGDFSILAQDYSKFRLGYSENITERILASSFKKIHEMNIADIGAGTGIFTRSLSKKNPKTLWAIEPNDNMRNEGKKFKDSKIKWIAGSAEHTTLPDNSLDLVTTASSFHWANTNKALAEFNRILCDKGIFTALWNPRITELSKIETKIDSILIKKYNIKKRISSGRSGITNKLTKILNNSSYFKKVDYCEYLNEVKISKDHYIGAWHSVNDIRSQLGEKKFSEFIKTIEKILINVNLIDVHYLTRAWIALK